MRYNEHLAARVAEKLEHLADVEGKEMFSGLVFMVNGKMCIGVMKDKLMLRINPASIAALEDKDGWEQMTMRTKAMNGYILVSEDVLIRNEDLDFWIELALEFNPLAKASKKKKKV
ncbi:TfoX family protein [Pedobacter frigidisoli]|uniref:TfoX family protein n=1 Tax=Pedobacter frigidisoli TaxID=2530455 RepID=A0A4R0P1W0_9SPHI|nr:TfoX/Sxy family protein [Pedobacter frigidisoli]TCD10783.1 TfoX family protein [Pedobacter frigidisoli]